MKAEMFVEKTEMGYSADDEKYTVFTVGFYFGRIKSSHRKLIGAKSFLIA